MTDSFLHLNFDEAIVPRTIKGDICYKKGSMPIAQGKQKGSLCFAVSDFFLAAYLFNFLRGRRGLPYLRLFIPANRVVAFCLLVTHPEVTFNSWTKKCVVMLYGAASQPEEITNIVNATELHSWPVVRASQQTEREREIQYKLLHQFKYDHKPCKNE